jgi:Flp pilus assembly protein TadD/predicted Zn-dependent protease with MMP-like domain
MSRPLRRAALLLVAAACTRPTPMDTPAASPGAPAARASVVAPASLRVDPGAPAPARPLPCLPGEPAAGPEALAGEAALALSGGDHSRAFACAEEATRLSPRLVAALAARAGALAALGRLEEARLAWARALAVDPDDPATLLGAAELHVRRLGPARDALETGLEHALRGVRAASARKDRPLASRLALVAAMAENDLGRSHLALRHLERAAAALPADADVAYERGVALYELCRFDEAQRAFERALALAPEDPWALHQLALVAERRGDEERARSLFVRARRLAPDEFRPDLPVDAAAFEAEVRAAVARLPDEERRALAAVPVEVQDLPDSADLLAVDPPLSPSILGLFRGPAEDEPCTAADGPRCRAIVFYRKNLLRFARDRAELVEQIRVTLLHELGHLHGEDDEQLRARGLE